MQRVRYYQRKHESGRERRTVYVYLGRYRTRSELGYHRCCQDTEREVPLLSALVDDCVFLAMPLPLLILIHGLICSPGGTHMDRLFVLGPNFGLKSRRKKRRRPRD